MQPLTPAGENIINDIARRYNLSYASAVSMLVAVNRGGGSMAQFHCPELGGGQWMRGGMTMVGDMFNHGLKATVDNLCNELSNALANNQMFPPAPQGGSGGGGSQWWPGDLGSPSSSGSQNHIRYAFFPQAQRLVVERDGQVSVFNTLDHRIGGVSQRQSGSTSLTFTSQYGTVSTLSLPLISGPGLERTTDPTNFAAAPSAPSSPAPAFPSQAPSSAAPGRGANRGGHDIVSLLEKLGQLRDSGVLTDAEFASKKAELLGRL
jgi:hypothetical protein